MPATVDELDGRVRKLENYFTVALAVIAVLGVGGGFIGSQLYSAYSKIDELKAQVSNLKRQLDNQTQDAMTKISNAGTNQLARIADFVNSEDYLSKASFIKKLNDRIDHIILKPIARPDLAAGHDCHDWPPPHPQTIPASIEADPSQAIFVSGVYNAIGCNVKNMNFFKELQFYIPPYNP